MPKLEKREGLDDLDHAILSVVEACGENAYGVVVYDALLARLKRRVGATTMYKRLMRMEQMGLVVSWETVGGSERGYYPKRYWAIVDSGRETLNAEEKEG